MGVHVCRGSKVARCPAFSGWDFNRHTRVSKGACLQSHHVCLQVKGFLSAYVHHLLVYLRIYTSFVSVSISFIFLHLSTHLYICRYLLHPPLHAHYTEIYLSLPEKSHVHCVCIDLVPFNGNNNCYATPGLSCHLVV